MRLPMVIIKTSGHLSLRWSDVLMNTNIKFGDLFHINKSRRAASDPWAGPHEPRANTSLCPPSTPASGVLTVWRVTRHSPVGRQQRPWEDGRQDDVARVSGRVSLQTLRRRNLWLTNKAFSAHRVRSGLWCIHQIWSPNRMPIKITQFIQFKFH